MTKVLFTDTSIRKLEARPKEFVLTDNSPTAPNAERGSGRLIVRVFSTGRKLFAVRLRRAEKSVNIPIGPFAPGAPEHWDVARARLAHERVILAVQRGVADCALARAVVDSSDAQLQAAAEATVQAAPSAPYRPTTAPLPVLPALTPNNIASVNWAMSLAVPASVLITSPAIGAQQSANPAIPGSSVIEAPSPPAQATKEVSAAAPTKVQPAVPAPPTLRQVVEDYVDALRLAGKSGSARDASSAFERHIGRPRPELASCDANLVRTEDLVDVVGEIFARGQKREAQRLRSLLATAYTRASSASNDPTLPKHARQRARVTINPVALIGRVKGANRPRNRVLSAVEIGHLVSRLRRMGTPAARAVELILLLGGQRAAQLLRAKVIDVDVDDWTIVVLDGKGRRDTPRQNVLPVLGHARTLLARCMQVAGQLGAEFLFTSNGQTALDPQTVSNLVSQLEKEMLATKQATASFDIRDLRRTVETRLAKKVSQDVRAQLLSHGLGGVQNQHYMRYEFAAEKVCAILAWQEYIENAVRQVGGPAAPPTPSGIAGEGSANDEAAQERAA